MARVVAVDWSGALVGASKHIWLAETVAPGGLVRLEAGRSRAELGGYLLSLADSTDLVVGFDFAFSFPAWFISSLGIASAPALWAHIAVRGEEWLAACQPPFWGRYPSLSPAHRALAIASEDAFDAAVSALVMIEHVDDLLSLPAETDPLLRLEGRIWHPHWRDDNLC